MPSPRSDKDHAANEINNRLFFRLFQVANTLHTKGTQAIEAFGVTTQQWSVLGALSRPQAANGMSINDLSRLLLVSRQNLTGLLSRLERDAWRRIPRRDTLIVLYGQYQNTDLAPLAVQRLQALGYTNVHRLDGGLEGWRQAGGELFRDVNVPSKSFGELVESQRHTPSMSAEEVQALLRRWL